VANKVAGEGEVWVCGSCGKRSKDLYGDQTISYGWDESCMINAVLCKEEFLDLSDIGRVVNIKEGGIIST